MDGGLNFYDTCIIADAVHVARESGELSLCPYTSGRNRQIWIEAFQAYLDGQLAKATPARLAA